MADTMPDLYAECATCDPEFRVYHLVDLRWTPIGTLSCRTCWEEATSCTGPAFNDLGTPVGRIDPTGARTWDDLARMAGGGGMTGAVGAAFMIGRVVTLRSHPLDAMTVTRTERAADIGEVEVAYMFDGRPAFAVLPIAALTDYSTDNL